MKNKISIGSVFGGKFRLPILLFLTKRSSSFKEIELGVDIYASALQILLKGFLRDKILISWYVGKRKYYGINKKLTFYKELINLINKISKYIELRNPNDKLKRFHRIPKHIKNKKDDYKK